MYPAILKNFNVFVNGRGCAGLCEEAELPELKIKTDTVRNGGMDGEKEVDMGTEAMSAKLKLSQPVRELIAAWGRDSNRIQLRGAYKADQQTPAIPVIVELGGLGKTFGGGSWKSGEKSVTEHEFAVDYFRYNQDGVDLVEIDVENMIRIVDGVDQLADIRAAIGI